MTNNNILILIAVVLIGILGVMVVNSQPRATPGDEINSGVHQIGQGISDAAHDATHNDHH